jgi:hypothetical protein
MLIKHIYKKLIPLRIREIISGNPWVENMRERRGHWLKEGRRLADEIRRTRKPDGKIRVLFIAQRPAYWPNYASVYEAMKADPGFEVSVIAIPRKNYGATDYSMDEYRRIVEFLEQHHIPFFKGYDLERSMWINPLVFGLPDVAFLPQPYRGLMAYPYEHPYLKHFCRLAIVSYGLPVINLPFAHYHSPAFSDSQFIFLESETHKALFIEQRAALSDRLFVVGHPKLDAYRGPPPTDMGLWKLPQARKRIIWAPHFTVTNNRTGHTFSNFFRYFDFFWKYAHSHPDVEFVLRPHPDLFTHMINMGLKTQAEAESYWTRFNALPNGQVYEGGDILTMFRQSDALILDSIGFLAEYAPTGNPICFLDSIRRQRLNPIGERLTHSYYAAWNADEIRSFIETVVLDGNDWRRAERLEMVQKTLYMPPDGAGMAIKTVIRDHFSHNDNSTSGIPTSGSAR